MVDLPSWPPFGSPIFEEKKLFLVLKCACALRSVCGKMEGIWKLCLCHCSSLIIYIFTAKLGYHYTARCAIASVGEQVSVSYIVRRSYCAVYWIWGSGLFCFAVNSTLWLTTSLSEKVLSWKWYTEKASNYINGVNLIFIVLIFSPPRYQASKHRTVLKA